MRDIIFLSKIAGKNLYFRQEFGLFVSEKSLEEFYNGENLNRGQFASAQFVVEDTFCCRAFCNCISPGTFDVDKAHFSSYKTPSFFGSYKELLSLSSIEHVFLALDNKTELIKSLFGTIQPYMQWLLNEEDKEISRNCTPFFEACFYPVIDVVSNKESFDDYDSFGIVGDGGFAAVAFYYVKNMAAHIALHIPSFQLTDFTIVKATIEKIHTEFRQAVATFKNVGSLYSLYCKYKENLICQENNDKISFTEDSARRKLLANEVAVLQQLLQKKGEHGIDSLISIQEGFIDRFQEEWKINLIAVDNVGATPVSSQNKTEADIRAALKPLLAKAKDAGLLDDNFQPVSSLSKSDIALLANKMAYICSISNKWKYFEDLWNVTKLANAYQKAQNRKKSGDFIENLNRIFK